MIKKRWRSQNPPPRSRLGLTGSESGWRRGFTGIGGGQIAGPAHLPFLEPPSFFILISIPPLATPCPWMLYAAWSPLFSLLGAAPIMSGQLPVARSGAPVTRGGLPGGQSPLKERVCGCWVEGQEPLQHLAGGQDQLQSSISGHPPMPKSHRHGPTTMDSSPTGQEFRAMVSDLSVWSIGLQPWTQQPKSSKGACWNRGPLLPVPYPIEANIPTEMVPMYVPG